MLYNADLDIAYRDSIGDNYLGVWAAAAALVDLDNLKVSFESDFRHHILLFWLILSNIIKK